MELQATGALALQPTGNVKGGFYFYNLAIGHIISRRQLTSLAIPTEAISVVHALAETYNASKGVNYNNNSPNPPHSKILEMQEWKTMKIKKKIRLQL